jgi:hypothetical protein
MLQRFCRRCKRKPGYVSGSASAARRFRAIQEGIVPQPREKDKEHLTVPAVLKLRTPISCSGSLGRHTLRGH